MKKIIALAIALIAVIATLSVGTFAYFTDTQVSTGNVFTAGTLDLGLNNTGTGNPTGDTTATFSASTWTPGSTTGAASLYINNAGNVAMGHVYVTFTYGTNATNDDGTILTSVPAGVNGNAATVSFAGHTTGSGATGLVEVDGGVVVGILLTSGGSSYDSPVTVTISGNGGGSGATATATQTGGVINPLITITSGGSNYNNFTANTDYFDKMITVASCSWQSASQTSIVGQSLYALRQAGPIALSTGLAATTITPLAMTFTYSSTATNGTQGNVLTMKVIVTGTQQ